MGDAPRNPTHRHATPRNSTHVFATNAIFTHVLATDALVVCNTRYFHALLATDALFSNKRYFDARFGHKRYFHRQRSQLRTVLQKYVKVVVFPFVFALEEHLHIFKKNDVASLVSTTNLAIIAFVKKKQKVISIGHLVDALFARSLFTLRVPLRLVACALPMQKCSVGGAGVHVIQDIADCGLLGFIRFWF